MQAVAIVLLVGMVWFAVKGTKAIRRKSTKHGLKLLGISLVLFLVMGAISGIMANTPQAKLQAAQEAAQLAAHQKAKQEQQAAQKVADEAKKKAADEARKKAEDEANSPHGKYNTWVQSLFSAWDGSVPSLVDTVKNQMNDPHSFEHVETTYTDKGNMKGIDVYMTYRGTNAFGGVVTNRVHASYDYNTKLFKSEMIK